MYLPPLLGFKISSSFGKITAISASFPKGTMNLKRYGMGKVPNDSNFSLKARVSKVDFIFK
jgi:hypothetical protein